MIVINIKVAFGLKRNDYFKIQFNASIILFGTLIDLSGN